MPVWYVSTDINEENDRSSYVAGQREGPFAQPRYEISIVS
jgi:hypothetical protein